MKEEDILDKILVHIGDFGKHQAIALFLICVVVIFNSATHMAFVFTAMDSEYRCLIQHCDAPNPEYNSSWITHAIPLDEFNKPSKCSMYARLMNGTSVNCSQAEFDTGQIVKCENFVFKESEHSIGKKYNLLCEDSWKLTLVGTFNSIGSFFGLLITGVISDRHGRKIVLLHGLTSCGVAGIIKSYSPTFEWFCFMEFLEAVFAAGSYGSAFILGVELVTPKNRVWTGCILFTSFAAGEVLIASLAWFLRDWRLIIYAAYGPCIFFIFFYWSIPESVRWYLSKGQVDKSRKILKKFAHANGKSVPELYFYTMKRNALQKEEDERVSFLEMLKSWTLLVRLIICCFLWVSCALLYYGLTFNSVTLSGNSHLDFILISLTEIPAYWVVSMVDQKMGRRVLLGGSYWITSVSCFAFVFIGKGPQWLRMVFYCLGKFGATSSFILVYLITSEIFPTPFRHTTMSLCSMIGRIGSALSPQIPLLSSFWKHFPLVLFGSAATISGILSFILPETLNMKLPDTVREAESIGQKSTDRKNHSNIML